MYLGGSEAMVGEQDDCGGKEQAEGKVQDQCPRQTFRTLFKGAKRWSAHIEYNLYMAVTRRGIRHSGTHGHGLACRCELLL